MFGLDWQLEVIYICRAQRSILISAELCFPVRYQSTNVHWAISQWPAETLSLPVALFRFWQHCRKVVREEQAKPGDHALETSNYTKGLLRLRG